MRLTILLVLVTMVLVGTACGGQPAPTAEPAAAEPTAEPSDAAAEAPTQGDTPEPTDTEESAEDDADPTATPTGEQATEAADATATLPIPQPDVEEPTIDIPASITAGAPSLGEVPGVQYSGNSVSQYAQSATASSGQAFQAAGLPNTTTCGDRPTAWSSGTPGGTATLTLVFGLPVTPTELRIIETFNPGAVVRVDVLTIGGAATTVYEAAPTSVGECPRTLSVPVTGVNVVINGAVITIDQSASGGLSQIDAVQLIGTQP
ncbi:MAG: hypothetical protein ACFB51_03235 [Anaerolineae bacterium]